MSLTSDIDLLGQVAFFKGFSDDHLRLIAFSAESRTLPEDMVLYDEGQLLHSAYVIKSGTVEAVRQGAAGSSIRVIGPGSLLAERALVVDMRAPETIRVREPVEALQIRRTVFRRFLEEYPEMAMAIRERFAQRLKTAAKDYARVGRKLSAIDY
jgi:CRP-like cAMP-binding protein